MQQVHVTRLVHVVGEMMPKFCFVVKTCVWIQAERKKYDLNGLDSVYCSWEQNNWVSDNTTCAYQSP